MIKLYLDAGHGGNDPGASGYGLKEKDLTLKIAKLIKSYLDDNYTGHTIKMSRTTDKTLSLAQRTNAANSWGADYVLSVHINSGGGTGFESFVYSGKLYKRTKDIRDNIHDEVMKQIEVEDRGKKDRNFHMVREPNASACLTENLFIDTKEDADKLKSRAFLKKLAKGHAIGIAKSFNLKKKSGGSNKPSAPKPKPSKPSNKGLEWVGTNLKGRRVESIYRGRDGLNFYDSPRWTNPTGTFSFGQGWKVDNLYRVNGTLMYRVQNSKGKLYWITASPKYVKVK